MYKRGSIGVAFTGPGLLHQVNSISIHSYIHTGGIWCSSRSDKLVKIERNIETLPAKLTVVADMLFSKLFIIVSFLAYVENLYGEVTPPEGTSDPEQQERVYFMKKCSGSGCPYTASWLSHINLFKRTPWWLDSTKMEAASFNMYIYLS